MKGFKVELSTAPSYQLDNLHKPSQEGACRVDEPPVLEPRASESEPGGKFRILDGLSVRRDFILDRQKALLPSQIQRRTSDPLPPVIYDQFPPYPFIYNK